MSIRKSIIVFFVSINTALYAQNTPLIPVEQFFKIADKGKLDLSPNGKYYSYVSKYENKQNVFIENIETGIPQIPTLRIPHYLLVFRAGSATPMEITTTRPAAVPGGVLRGTQAMLGTATWTAAMALQAETTAVREMGFQFVASRINSVLALQIFILSYSIGQVAYQSVSDTTGSVSQGVQQAFGISTLILEENSP